jgi:hypothetical protein
MPVYLGLIGLYRSKRRGIIDEGKRRKVWKEGAKSEVRGIGMAWDLIGAFARSPMYMVGRSRRGPGSL